MRKTFFFASIDERWKSFLMMNLFNNVFYWLRRVPTNHFHLHDFVFLFLHVAINIFRQNKETKFPQTFLENEKIFQIFCGEF